MIRGLLLATTIMAVPVAARAQCAQVPPTNPLQTGSNGFSVIGGQIIGPNGLPFKAQGIDVLESTLGDVVSDPSGGKLLATFPGTNMVRIAMESGYNSYSDPAFVNAVNWLTAKGIVVEIGNYNLFQTAPTGQDLQNEVNWFTQLAAIYKNNPYVWFSTANEPQPNPGSISAEHQAVYNAIRGVGNNSMISLDALGAYTVNTLDPSAYSSMTNVSWDAHSYNWMTNYSTDVGTNQARLQQEISELQTIHSGDGTIPVIVGEFGNATDGNTIDPGGTQTVQAVLDVSQACSGDTAWLDYWPGAATMGDELVDQTTGQLTPYGQQIASAMRGAPPAPPSPTTPPQQPQAAAMPASPPQAPDSPVPTGMPDPVIDQTPPDPLDVPNSTSPVVLAQNSPGGQAPSLTPPPGISSLDAAGFTELSGDDGNHTISVSNQGNVIVETGGVQQVTVPGDNNAIDLGPYDDSVTISGIGNTVNAGGGVNNITLSYSGTPPPVLLGNVIVLPSPGTGEDIISGKMRGDDRIDLTQALAGTMWDHTAATMANFYTASNTAAGYVITVAGKVVALFPDGVPGNDITAFLTAH